MASGLPGRENECRTRTEGSATTRSIYEAALSGPRVSGASPPVRHGPAARLLPGQDRLTTLLRVPPPARQLFSQHHLSQVPGEALGFAGCHRSIDRTRIPTHRCDGVRQTARTSSKDDLVRTDDYDPLIIEACRALPGELGPIEAIR